MDKKNENTNKKRKSFLSLLFKNLFGNRKELSIFEEEQVQSPFRTVLRTFGSNKVSMTALGIFLIIFFISMIGPLIMPIDLSFMETTQQNVAPGLDLMEFPESLNGKIADIAIGPTFSVGASTDGDVLVWGKTRISNTIDIKKMLPGDMGKVVKLAAGHDHVLALNEEGQVFSWGNDRQGQVSLPYELEFTYNIKDIIAGYQISLVLTEDGRLIHFGNTMNTDYNEFHEYQGKLDKVVATSDGILGLTFDGEVVYLGNQQNSYTNIPENMGRVVDLATTATSIAALNAEGEVFVWGNATGNQRQVPETASKIVSIKGGRTHYTAITEDGSVVAWGEDFYKQSTLPDKVKNSKISDVFTGYYQNYAITEDGEILTWGLKGYILGTDGLGRDLLGRLINGGRMSISIGAVAVIIATIIGVLVGSISGFVGGKVDMFLQRVAEIVGSLPFLPFAMILSSLIGNAMTSEQRVVLIMVILGLLSWTGLQRLVRAQVLSVREQEYVTAARAIGVKKGQIIFKHILPNVISVILVSSTLSFASSMLIEASLSYLGFGVQAPIPTWGNMLYGANDSIVIQNYWWRWVFASIVLGICVICVNLIGDGLRDAIDPRSQER